MRFTSRRSRGRPPGRIDTSTRHRKRGQN